MKIYEALSNYNSPIF